MAKIKTFEEACEKKGYNPETIIPDFSVFPEKHRKALTSHAKLIIITEVLNGDWKPDWSNGKWDKFFPWFYMNTSSGSLFAYFGYDFADSSSGVGSRLCFKSEALARYAGEQFNDLYRDYFLLD